LYRFAFKVVSLFAPTDKHEPHDATTIEHIVDDDEHN